MQVTGFLFFLAKAFVMLGMGALTYFYYDRYQPYRLNYIAVPVAIVMIGSYLIATIFFGVYTMAVNTLFLCFRKLHFRRSDYACTLIDLYYFLVEDSERNDGSEEKPYKMSKNLMKILGKKNEFSRSN